MSKDKDKEQDKSFEVVKFESMQLTFLPVIDRKATQKRVEERLEEVRVYKHIGFEEREAKLTPSYDPRFHGSTNAISKTTEAIAVSNTSNEERILKLIERTEKAVHRLPKKEREIILKRYFDDDDMLDYIVYNDLGISEKTYYRIKSKAFYKLAFALNLEVVKE